jgi:phosphonate transport system substrate-binding protein
VLRRPHLSTLPSALALLVTSLLLAGCSPSSSAPAVGGQRTLHVSAIPDQDPEKLAVREEALAAHLSTTLDVDVEYVPVSDYAASVSLLRTGDLDLVFYGGLTGVQARLQAPGATVIAQRDIDRDFHSVFIASASSGIRPVSTVQGLAALRGRRFTFGSESSTSGRLMPEHFLAQAGVDSAEDFAGPPGYSGSHDKTIALVQSGSFEAGVLNAQVWEAAKADGTVPPGTVVEVFVTPGYPDYHWVAGPATDERFGAGFTERLRTALLSLDHTDSEDAALLDRYGAKAFVAAEPGDYARIEQVARRLGLIS